MKKTPAPATRDVGTPDSVKKILAGANAKRTPAKAPPPQPAPKVPKLPGDSLPAPEKKRRGRKPGGTSMHPDAIKARERRAAKRARLGTTLPPPPLPDLSTMPRDALRAPAGPAMSGPVRSFITPEKRGAAVSSMSGLIKAIGIGCALFMGDHWKVSDPDALGTSELILDAWPELADELGDMTKVLAVSAVGGLVMERVGKTRKAGRPVKVAADPAPEGTVPLTNAQTRDGHETQHDESRALGWSS